jgi:hypothetical protein
MSMSDVGKKWREVHFGGAVKWLIIGSVVSCGVDFQQNLGYEKVMDSGNQQSAKLVWPLTAPGT